jgi:TatD DNase family protein
MYVDTHVHLNDERLYGNLHEVIDDALANKVTLMNVVGYDRASSLLAVDIAKKYPFIYATVGFHPTEIGNVTEEDFRWLENLANDEKVIAIGEIGFDYHWDRTTREQQASAFQRQIELAIKLQKPLVIHSREATQDTYQMLYKSFQKLPGGVMHAYSGSYEMAKEFNKMHFLIGIGGVVTFKNAKEIKEIVQRIDSSFLLTETDSPYLTPHPYRGTTNYPKYIPLILSEMARIRNMSESELALIIRQNTSKLFKIQS